MKNVESSIASMKNIFQNFVKYTSGIKSFCRDFCIANKTIYDKNSSFGSLANDITDCHSQIERSYEELITSVNEINLATNQWNSIFNQSKVKFNNFRILFISVRNQGKYLITMMRKWRSYIDLDKIK